MTTTPTERMIAMLTEQKFTLVRERDEAIRERDEARLQVERCKVIIDDYIKDIAKQKTALIQAQSMMARLHSKIQEFEAREQ